jgi:SAM-dependent methyltransferase
MFAKLDKAIKDILCCPLCKSPLTVGQYQFACIACGMVYPQKTLGKSNDHEYVFDFRVHPLNHSTPISLAKWSEIQQEFIKGDARRKRKDDLKHYLEEIDSVKEIYTEQFKMKGSILDVGGHQGRLRHFLSSNDVTLYVSVDPYLHTFEGIKYQPNLLKAYPCLSQPCNFIACHGENLPIKSKTFDWVHMRSILDHVYDPHRVMIEAYRVLKDDGMVLIGLAVSGGRSTLKAERREKPTYVSPFVPKILRFLKSLGMIRAAKYELKLFSSKPLDDGHMCRWEYENLVDLLKNTNFAIVKEHWQKPPYDACVYIAAKKQSMSL